MLVVVVFVGMVVEVVGDVAVTSDLLVCSLLFVAVVNQIVVVIAVLALAVAMIVVTVNCVLAASVDRSGCNSSLLSSGFGILSLLFEMKNANGRSLANKSVDTMAYSGCVKKWLTAGTIQPVRTRLGPVLVKETSNVTPNMLKAVLILIEAFCDVGLSNAVIQVHP